MFKRKVLVIAFLAVVLLGSLMDGRVDADRQYKHKRRAAAESSIMQIVPDFIQASLTNLTDQNDDIEQFSFEGKRGRRKPRASFDPGGMNQMAGGITAIDPTNG